MPAGYPARHLAHKCPCRASWVATGMKSPTVEDHTLLLMVFLGLFSQKEFYDSLRKKSRRKTRDQILETVKLLKADKDTLKIAILPKTISNASIMQLCKTHKSLNMPGVKTPNICRQLRKFLKSNEACTCPAKISKENFADANINNFENIEVKP